MIVGSPPSAETRHSPVRGALVANVMVLSSPQLAPRGIPLNWQSVIAGPPAIDTFFRSAFSKNPIHWLSGEKNGAYAQLTSATGSASSRSIARTISGLPVVFDPPAR